MHTTTGISTEAVYIFNNMLRKLEKTYAPEYIAAIFESGAPVARMAESTLAAVERAGMTLEDIDLFVYHQANARITRALGERLGLDPAKVVDCIENLGNSSAATLPLGLVAAERDGLLKPGARVLLSAFGAGFTWGAGVIEWGGTV